MFSTLSSFLPAVLSDKLDKLDKTDSLPEESGNKQQTDEQGVKRKDMLDKKEKKKKVTSYETFIVVRPPPAKSNHPLNLQLQLVPAHHSRERSNTSTLATPTESRFPTELGQGNDQVSQSPPSPSASDSDHGLKRTPSTRSETSAFYASSSAASTGSVTSFASTTSTGSARRMIIPLYNLSAHNVMTNTILDAGTDARVAKFHKRGLEILDLAILEPTEVWYGKDHAHGAGVGAASDPFGVPIRRSVSGNSSLAPPGQNENGSRATTPDPLHSPGSSRQSLSSEHSSSAGHHVLPTTDPAIIPAATPTGAKKLFGKIFKKKGSSAGGPTTPTPSASVFSAAPSPPRQVAPLPEVRYPVPVEVLLPAVLGLSPTLSAPMNPPTGRCISYVWIVRKWLKAENQGLITGVLGKIGREASAHGIGHMGVQGPILWEIRFEWTRSKSKGEKARKTRRQRSVDAGGRSGSQTPSRRNSVVVGLEDVHELERTDSNLVESPRQSLDVKRSTARATSPGWDPSKAASVTSTNHSDDEAVHGDDAGNESDPEDSETPWTCYMIITHSTLPVTPIASSFSKGHSRTRTVSSSAIHPPTTPTPENIHAFISDNGHSPISPQTPTLTKLRVATLAPAPHHPKVVCQLKIPYPLPDVEVEQGLLRKRLVLPDGSTRSTLPARDGVGGVMGSLILTAEEIKDVVCSTAFWVVVREGFGGLGKKARKGDGWKIRG